MNAWLQRITVLAQALAALALAYAAALALGRAIGLSALLAWASGLGLGLLAMLALQALVVGRGFVLAWRINRHRPGGRDIAVRAWLAAWLRECGVSLRVFSWWQPWRSRAEPDLLPADARGRTAVLLLHGYYCNRALWTEAMRRLRAHGIPHLALTLEPAFGSIDDYAAAIDGAITRLHAATGRPLRIVAHSMGGLAARAWIASLAPDQRLQALDRIEQIVTIGTPHHGTALADAHARWPIGTNGRQMRRDSAWLQANAGQLGEAWRAKFVCVYSPTDNIVMPCDSAVLEGARSWRFDTFGHVELVFAPPLAPLWTGAELAPVQDMIPPPPC